MDIKYINNTILYEQIAVAAILKLEACIANNIIDRSLRSVR